MRRPRRRPWARLGRSARMIALVLLAVVLGGVALVVEGVILKLSAGLIPPVLPGS